MTRLSRRPASRVLLSGLLAVLLGGLLSMPVFADVTRTAAGSPPSTVATTPSITGMTGPPDSTYSNGDVLEFTVDYDETVTVSSSPVIELDIGGTTRSAAFVSGDGTQTLTFSYTVQDGDDDADGISFASTSIQGGSIEDTDGDAANRDFSGVAPDLSGVRADGTAPTITSFSATTASDQNVSVSVEADERLVAGGDSLLVNLDGPESATLTGSEFTETTSGGPWTYTAIYGGNSDGLYSATLVTARDTAGNDGASGETTDVVVDTEAPSIVAADLSGDNATVELAFSEGVYANTDTSGGLASSDFSASLSQNGGNVTAVSVSGVTDLAGASPTGGEDTLRVSLTLTDGPASGEESVTIGPADASSIYDAAGTAMADTESTGAISLHDRAAPSNLSVDQPTSGVLRASIATYGGDTSLDIGYSYDDATPDTTVVTFTDGTNTDGTNAATYGLDDRSYAGDGNQKTVTLDLTNPDTESGGFVDSTSYEIELVAVDSAGNADTTRTSRLLTIDNTPPPVQNISLSNDGNDNLAVTVDTEEELSSADSDLRVTVEGPASGSGWKVFTGADFSESQTGGGTFTYTLETTQGYTDGSGTYTATLTTARDPVGNDGAEGSDMDTYTFNTAPTAVTDRDTTSEDVAVSKSAPGVLANDSDPNGDALSVTAVNGSSPGSQVTLASGALLTVNGDGSYTYDPNGQYEDLGARDTTTDVFTYSVEDPFGASDQATDTLFVTGVNDAPTLRDSTYATTEDDTLFQSAPGVFENDTDPEGDALQVTLVNGGSDVGSEITLPSGATLTLDANGAFTYIPTQTQIDTLALGETITDSFSYTATDGNGGTGTATATIEISGENDAPIVETNDVLAVSSTGDSKTITTGDLSASDRDHEPQNLTFTITSPPSSGTLIVDGTSGAGSFTQKQLQDGAVTYQHDGSATTTDAFSFDLTDPEGAGPGSTPFDIVIGLNNSAPTAASDDSSTTENDVLAVADSVNGVLSNDSDSDGDPLVVSEVNSVSGNVGTEIQLTSGALLTIHQDGTYTYKPNGRFEDLGNGDTNSESVSYTVADGKGGDDTATLSITIEGVNDPPTLETNAGLVVDRGATETITILNLSAADPDDPASSVTFAVTSAPDHGNLLRNGTVLSAGDSFTQQDIVDGVVAYENPRGTSGDDSFTFDLTDGTDPGPSGQTFTISPSNRPPTASGDAYSTPEDQILAVTDSTNGVLGNDDDPDGDRLTASIVSTPSHGGLTLNQDGTFEYDPATNYYGDDSFTYQVSDENGETDQAIVDLTISSVNDPPQVSTNTGISVSQTGQTAITTSELSASDVDDAPDQLTFTVTSGPSQGGLLVSGTDSTQFTQQTLADGAVSYDHTAQTADDDQFTFSLTDSSGAGPTGRTFIVSVSESNLAPTARDTTLATSEDTVATGSAPGILGNDSDPDGDGLSVSAVNGGGGGNVGSEITLSSGALLTVRGNGSYAYDPNDQFEDLKNGETASDSFTYRATDGNGGTDQATVSVTVEGKNERPTVTLIAPPTGAVVSVGETVTVEASASDADGSIQEVSFEAGSTSLGTDTSPSDGFHVTWTPQQSGTRQLTAVATDNVGASVESPGLEVRVRPAAVGISVERQFPNPTEKSGFRLVALPGSAGQTLESTLSEVPTDDWRAFRETGGTDSLAYNREKCSPGSCSLRPGNGYWLISRQSWTVDDSLDTVTLRPGSTQAVSVYTLPVHGGWNVISNPLEVDVAWNAVQQASGTSQNLWRWDGSWEPVTTFASATDGEAFYFRDDQLDSLTVPFPGGASASASGPESSKAANREGRRDGRSAELSLRIDRPDGGASFVRAGIQPESESGFDDADRYGPPGYFGGATLRLVARDGQKRHILSAERKPPEQEGYAYNVRLRSRPDTTIRIAAEGLQSFSQEQISLVRRSTARSYDLRADSTITVVAHHRTTRFQLLIGSEAFVDRARKELAPKEPLLRPNYPEPFRQSTTLEYSLPERQHVRLTVYDLLGRHVETLVDRTEAAGFHQLQWPEAGGRAFSSGVYFVRLESGSTTKTERLVIVR